MDVCISAEKCGGCTYQGVDYSVQLKEKEEAVRGLLSSAGFDPALLSGIEGCPEHSAYRNKMEYSFGNEVIDGPLQLGLHQKKRFMSVVYTGACQIVPEDFNRLLNATLEFCRERGYSFYHRKRHEGLLRYLILRRGVRTGQLLINIVTGGETDGGFHFDKQGAYEGIECDKTCKAGGGSGGSGKACRFAFDEPGYINMIMSIKLDNQVCGILHTIDRGISDGINPSEARVLYGNPYYMEKVMGLDFKVGAFSFFQTNVPAAERLYKDAISLLKGIEGKTVYDLYCGTGTISQAMATRAAKVYGVEISREAVDAARDNAGLNGLDNCSFICGDVLSSLDAIEQKPDIIVVDPPRSGIHPRAMAKICAYGVDQIVYISCNPKTMAENLKTAAEAGYRLSYAKAYDNFPFTSHVEAVVLLCRTKC